MKLTGPTLLLPTSGSADLAMAHCRVSAAILDLVVAAGDTPATSSLTAACCERAQAHLERCRELISQTVAPVGPAWFRAWLDARARRAPDDHARDGDCVSRLAAIVATKVEATPEAEHAG